MNLLWIVEPPENLDPGPNDETQMLYVQQFVTKENNSCISEQERT